MTPKKFGSLSSSVNPQELSLTVQSASKVIIGLIAYYAVYRGFDAQQVTSQLQAIVDVIVTAIPAGFTIYHSIQMVWGLTRKFLVYIGTRGQVSSVPLNVPVAPQQ